MVKCEKRQISSIATVNVTNKIVKYETEKQIETIFTFGIFSLVSWLCHLTASECDPPILLIWEV